MAPRSQDVDLTRDAVAEHIDQEIWDKRAKEIQEPLPRIDELIEELGETLAQEFPELWS